MLDGKILKLDKLDLVIADSKQPLALAGIMGGQGSSVTGATGNIFLESAWFRPESIGMRARHYGLHSESSHRFERGVDPALQREALERATSLVLEICGGKAGRITEAVSKGDLPKRSPILLRERRIERVLGMRFPPGKVRSILGRLGMKLSPSSDKKSRAWRVVPPSWRFDMVPQGRVGLGSRVKVKDRGTGNVEELELVIPEAMDFDLGHISVSSPLGRGLVDRGVGDVATIQLPSGVRELEILHLRTLHDQLTDAEAGPDA